MQSSSKGFFERTDNSARRKGGAPLAAKTGRDMEPGPARLKYGRRDRGWNRCRRSRRRWLLDRTRGRTGTSRAARVEAFGPPERAARPPATTAGAAGLSKGSVQRPHLAEVHGQHAYSPGTELSWWDGHKGMPGEASERGRRGSTASTARLCGGVAEGAKGPLGGRGPHREASPRRGWHLWLGCRVQACQGVVVGEVFFLEALADFIEGGEQRAGPGKVQGHSAFTVKLSARLSHSLSEAPLLSGETGEDNQKSE